MTTSEFPVRRLPSSSSLSLSWSLALATIAGCCAIAGVTVFAQGRGNLEWTTVGADAQRSSWIRADAKISTASLAKPGWFTFLWKLRVDPDTKQLNALTQPVLLDRIIGFRGFKSMAFVASSSETVYAIDTDFGIQLWRTHLNYGASFPPITAGTIACPGGLTAAVTRPTSLLAAPPPAAAAGAGGRGGRSGGGVGLPGQGAATIATAGQARGAGPGRGAAAARGGVTVPGSAAAVAAGGRAGGGRGAPAGAPDAAYVVGSDGYVRALNVQNGWELFPPVMFTPANARTAGLILVNDDTTGMLYTATSQGCGSTPDGVWAVDLVSPQKPVISWSAGGATMAGTSGPAFGNDGTLYVATSDGTAPLSNSIVALDRKTLKPTGLATVASAKFTTSPLVFPWKGRDVVAVSGGGQLYLFDGASLSEPLARSARYGRADDEGGALASWLDAEGIRWILVPSAGPVKAEGTGPAANGVVTRGALVAFKVIEDADGKLVVRPAWVSRDLTAPTTPLIVNGVVFAASSGEFRSADKTMTAAVRARRSVPAVLYALDGATGRQLWSSGTAMTSFARGGLSAGNGVVYVPTFDGTLYAFGVPIEK